MSGLDMEFPEFSAGLGKLRAAILDARRRIHAALRLDEIELLSDSFSLIGGRFDRSILIADWEFDADGLALCSTHSEWLRRRGYPVRAVRAELEPSFVVVDEWVFVPQVPARILKETDGKVLARFEAIFEQAQGLPAVNAPPYNSDEDEYFEEFSWFPVPLNGPSAEDAELNGLLKRLHNAVRRRAPDKVCLSKWSQFVRARDGGKCVVCGGITRLAAHHICRKTLLPEARFMTGNGITLCSECHGEAHEGFNGRPDLQQLMDAERGEKIELLADLYWQLSAASTRKSDSDPAYYYLSTQVLAKFKMLQGYEWDHEIRGSRIEQAAYIWRGVPVSTAYALIKANLPSSMLRPPDR